jgi:dihydrodipicolinate synthase/N-acetylneuraminate lyase
MDLDQFRDAVETFMEAVRQYDGLGHQVGCGAFSQRQVFKRIEIARANGVEAVQINLPGWVPLTDDEILGFYGAISERFPGLAIIIYDNRACGRYVGPELWPRLVEQVPAIVGGKMPYDTPDVLNAIRRVRPEFKFFAVETTLEAMAPHGIDGVTAWISYSFPGTIGDLWSAAEARNWEKFRECLETTRLLHEIKTEIRPKGYRAGRMDRLMGLASGFLEPVFSRVLSPWENVVQDDVDWVRTQIVERLGEEFLFTP